MFTTVAYSESQDSATLVNIAALADAHVRVSGDDILVPRGLNFLLGWYFCGANFTQGRIDSPTIRRLFPIDASKGDNVDEPASPTALEWIGESPVELDETEALNTLMAEDAVGASRVTAIIWLGDGPVAPVTEPSQTIRATNTSTLAANAWTNGALTFAQSLPAGSYRVVGMRAESAGLRAARLVPVGAAHRPGVLGFDADSDVDIEEFFRRGRIGEFATFDHDAPPTVDFLSLSADTSQVVHLDLVRAS